MQPTRRHSRIELLGVAQAADEQRRRDEERRGERHLADDERTAQPLTARDPAGSGAQRFVRLGAGEDQRRSAPEDDRGDGAGAQGEEEHRAVDGERPQPRNGGWQEGSDRVERDGAGADADDSGSAGQDSALDAELAQQLPAGRSERRADR